MRPSLPLTAPAMRRVGGLLSGSGRAAKLLILTYHRVLPCVDPMVDGTVDAATFEWRMTLLAEHFTVLPLREAVTRLQAGALPPCAVCVTFDDGYADNAAIALPILNSGAPPASLQVIGNVDSDPHLLGLGRWLEEAGIVGFTPVPGNSPNASAG